MTRSLDEIEVTYDPEEDIYGEHAEITVKWAAEYALDEFDPAHNWIPEEANAAAFGYPTKAEHVEASVFVAGLLGRLAYVAYPWIAWSGQQHGCPRGWSPPGAFPSREAPMQSFDCCCLADAGVFDPQDWPSNGLEMWFYVPTEDAGEWLDRIRGWLQTLTGPTT